MDNLSALSSQLPAKKMAEQELKEIDATIVQEFKTAASAVTKLFKLSGGKAALARDQGYTDALRDLLDALDHNEDARGWALKRLLELAPERAGDGPQAGHQPSTQAQIPQAQITQAQTPQAQTAAITFQSSIAFPSEIKDTGDSESDDQDTDTGGKRRILFDGDAAFKRRRRANH